LRPSRRRRGGTGRAILFARGLPFASAFCQRGSLVRCRGPLPRNTDRPISIVGLSPRGRLLRAGGLRVAAPAQPTRLRQFGLVDVDHNDRTRRPIRPRAACRAPRRRREPATPWGSDPAAGSCRSSRDRLPRPPPPRGIAPRAASLPSPSRTTRRGLFLHPPPTPHRPRPRLPPQRCRPHSGPLPSPLPRAPAVPCRVRSARRRPEHAFGCGWTDGALPRSSSWTRPPSFAAPACPRGTSASLALSSPTPQASSVSAFPPFVPDRFWG
jgi:hypothetical protein